MTPVHWPNGALGSLVLNDQQRAATQHHLRILDTFFRRDTAIKDCPARIPRPLDLPKTSPGLAAMLQHLRAPGIRNPKPDDIDVDVERQ